MDGSQWEVCLLAYSTNVVGFGQSNVPLFAPTGSPRVFDPPVLIVHGGGEGHMVVAGSTVCEDALLVEGPVVSVHHHCDWLLLHG